MFDDFDSPEERAAANLARVRGELARSVVNIILHGLCLFGFMILAWIVGSVLFIGCKPAELPAPCDSVTLAAGTARCRVLVREHCPRDGGRVDESCTQLRACDKWVDDWLACHPGEAQPSSVGAGGAQ